MSGAGNCQNGHVEVVTVLIASNANVNQADDEGTAPLWIACHNGHAENVTTLIAANANVNQADNNGATPLYTACTEGHTEVVVTLIAANAEVNQADNRGATALYVACQKGHNEIIATLLAANADVNQANNNGATPMSTTCYFGHRGCVQLLSSYGASRTWPRPAPYDTAEHVATRKGHHAITGWLRASPGWTALHHLEVLTPARALALLRGGADVNGAGPSTPLDLAKHLCSIGAAAAGSAAHVVLEWGAPWRRTTHKFYPPAVRARVAVLMRIAQAIKRGKAAYEADGVFVAFASPAAVADVFESCVIPHLIASQLWR